LRGKEQVTETGPSLRAEARATRAPGRTKFIIGGAIVVVVVAWLIYSSIGSSTAYYMTTQELLTGEPPDRIVRVAGLVAGQTISWDSRQMVLQFEIADEGGSLPVLYHGPQPDMLRDGAEAVVEGRYMDSGVFEASSIILKCPSKYVEE
jgi:cytochrome c-type biogenesis protein CcmE